MKKILSLLAIVLFVSATAIAQESPSNSSNEPVSTQVTVSENSDAPDAEASVKASGKSSAKACCSKGSKKSCSAAEKAACNHSSKSKAGCSHGKSEATIEKKSKDTPNN